jgi:hypothetical protein
MAEVIGVLACSRTKAADARPAVELYTGPVFRLARRYLEGLGASRLVVLSALHGAVVGAQVLEPYEHGLLTLGARARRDWALRTWAQLHGLVPSGARVVAVVPALYAPALAGIPHERHFAGLSVGYLKQALGAAVRLQELA